MLGVSYATLVMATMSESLMGVSIRSQLFSGKLVVDFCLFTISRIKRIAILFFMGQMEVERVLSLKTFVNTYSQLFHEQLRCLLSAEMLLGVWRLEYNPKSVSV